MWVVTTLNCPMSVDGTINVDHFRCLVRVEITWVQRPGSSSEFSWASDQKDREFRGSRVQGFKVA